MKKLLALILAVCLLAGCQLASQEKKEDQLQDKLVGVFLTFEDLDLEFDIEGYLGDNAGSLADGGEIVLEPGEGMEYEEKLWAEVSDDGWSFLGYEGIVMGQLWREDHWAGFSTEGICEHKTSVNRTDMLDSIDEEGTIYFPAGSNVMLCSNPVYMTTDGRYYTLRGNSFHSRIEEGGSMSQSVSDEKTWTEGDTEFTYSAKFTATVRGVTLAEQVVLVWMGEGNEELKREEYVPGQLPESVRADCAYLIAEEITGDSVTRTLYQPGDESMTVYYQGEQPWCLPEFVEIIWPE